MGNWNYTTYVKFNVGENPMPDLGWIANAVIQVNGVIADWFVNKLSVAVETDSGGTPV